MTPTPRQSNCRTASGATTHGAGGFSPRGLANSENAAQLESPRGLKPAARLRSSAFTLIEMLVAVGLLLVMMGLASQVFKIALDGTGRLTQLSEVNRSVRMFEDQLRRELGTVDPTRSILGIQPHPSPAYWTEEQQMQDDDGNALNGIGNQQFSIDPLRENPTLGYDVLDARSTTGNPSPDGSYDWTTNDDFYPLRPRADILMFVASLPDERSKVDDSIKSDGPVMIVYNHAELGELVPRNVNVRVTSNFGPGAVYREFGVDYNNDSTDDWAGGSLSPIPALQNGGGMDPRSGVQLIARDWHLARRAILLKNTFDSKEKLPAGAGFDRYAHVLSPTNPSGNQAQCVGFLPDPLPPPCNVLIDSEWERHYLNWILGGEMDVVSPAGGPVSAAFWDPPGSNRQDFIYEYEVPNRYFGGPPGTLDLLAADANGDGFQDENGAVMTRTGTGALAGYRGAVPAWWLGRSQLDLEPSAATRHRLGHYFLANCASFKVEWTPNDIRLEQAGLPEVVWIDPFKEPGANNRFGAPLPSTHPDNPITPGGVTKPAHLDEFEIMAQKMAPETGMPLAGNATLGGPGSGSPFVPNGSLLYQVHQSLMPRFGLSIPLAAGGVLPLQANVFDGDPATVGTVEPSYNTHSWYAKDLELLPDGLGGFRPKTSTGSDPMWPKALRITVDLFDDAGKLDRPVRHTFIVPIGSKGDRKSS